MSSERPETPNLGDRPLSPHLQVYHFGWTMGFSILHRVTGVGLSLGTVLLLWWLLAMMQGPEAYAQAQAFFAHWFGRLLLFGWSLALIYHFCNGIRHLLWDTGWGLDLVTARASAMVVAVATVLLTGLVWAAAYGLLGGGS